MKLRSVGVIIAIIALLLSLPTPGLAEVRVSRAELKGSDLHVEGDAVPNARIFIDGVERGRADDRGRFKITVAFFSSPRCRIKVDDGTGAVEATLSGCTPTRSGPPPPEFGTMTAEVLEGNTARYAVGVTGQPGEEVAFTFDWGDGSAPTRVPPAGFETLEPKPGQTTIGLASAFAEHVYAQAGTFTLQIATLDPEGRTAAAEPFTVTVIEDDQTDCGRPGDAPNELPDTRPVAIGVTCAGHLAEFHLDPVDNYGFDISDPGKLLTIKGIVPRTMINPSDTSELVNDEVSGFDRAVGDSVAHTTHQAGPWILQVGAGREIGPGQPGGTPDVRGDYSFTLHYGGGGDDCAGGRRPVLASPTDAPNNDGAVELLENGEVNCVGFLPHADADLLDIYGFEVLEEGEIVAVMVEPADGSPCDRRFEVPGVDDEPFLDGRIPEARCAQMFFEAGVGRGPGPGAFPVFAMQARWPSPQTLSYRLNLATSRPDRHSGDCFTGGDAGNTFATATLLRDWPVCIGDLVGTDAEDWYRIPARDGDRLGLLLRPAARPQVDLYDPQGQHRAILADFGGFIIDQDGDWRLRVRDRDGFPGTYGFRVDFRPGSPGRDCASGGDTPLTGLPVTLPVDCMGSFVRYPDDTNDHYNFHLDQGDVVEVTMQTHLRNPAWLSSSLFTASLSAPSTPNVETGWRFSTGGRTFTHTAQETGTYQLNIAATPTIAWDTRYSLTIRVAEATESPDLRASISSRETSYPRGFVFEVEGGAFLPSGSPPARDVTLTLSASPSDAVSLRESNFDSFPDGVKPTWTVSVGDVPSPGSERHTWSLGADREGDVVLTITARDATGVVATISGTFQINK